MNLIISVLIVVGAATLACLVDNFLPASRVPLDYPEDTE